MCGEQHRAVQLDLVHGVPHEAAVHRVHARRRLVQHHELGIALERGRARNHPPPPVGKGAALLARDLVRDAQLREDGVYLPSSISVAVIFLQENSQKIKKIKNLFSNDKDSYLIDCYELDRGSKIKILNEFLKVNKLKISQSVYWFLIDKLDSKYIFFEKNLIKVLELDREDITSVSYTHLTLPTKA